MNGFFWAKRYLFKQKRRTFLTAFGIALAIALVCGTCVLADSFRRSLFPVKGLHQEARMFPDQFSGT